MVRQSALHIWLWLLHYEELQVLDWQTKGFQESMDVTTGLEDWNSLNCYKKPFSWYNSFLESSYSLSHITNLLHALLSVLPLSFGGQRSLHT